MRYETDDVGRKIPARYVSFGRQRGNSSLQTQQFPGAWGPSPATGTYQIPVYPSITGREMVGTDPMPQPTYKTVTNAGSDPYWMSRQIANQALGQTSTASPYANPLYTATTNPRFGPQTPAEENLIKSLLNLTAGKNASAGLGAPTQLALSSAIAPTVVGMQNQAVQNLLGAGKDWSTNQGITLQALLELLGYAMPQTVAGQQSSQSGWDFGIRLAGGGSGGGKTT